MSDAEDNELQAILDEANDESDELLVDMTDAVDFEPITGIRPVEVVGVVAGKSKTAPYHPKIELKLRVFEGVDKGRVVFQNCMLKGKGAGITKRTLDSLDAGVDWTAPRISPAKLLGLRGLAVLAPDSREEYAHKTVVKDVRPYVGDDVELPD